MKFKIEFHNGSYVTVEGDRLGLRPDTVDVWRNGECGPFGTKVFTAQAEAVKWAGAVEDATPAPGVER